MNNRVGQQIGNYRLVYQLGQGGFADTYLGEQVHLKTYAAIKILQTQLSQEDQQRFLEEARVIAHLTHPNIVRVLDFGIDAPSNTPYLVMEYAPNGTLRSRYPRGIALPVTMILPHTRQIAAALSYAHSQKVIHRDVKPENMLISANNEALLSDFGIAIIAQNTRTVNAQDVAGTVTYMAPEQIEGKPRPASDQYALGVVVYEWLTGKVPFTGTYTEVAIQQQHSMPTPLRNIDPSIPPDVERVVLTALAKDPQRRFGSVEAFANALSQAAQEARPSPSSPSSTMWPAAQSPSPSSATLPVSSPLGEQLNFPPPAPPSAAGANEQKNYTPPAAPPPPQTGYGVPAEFYNNYGNVPNAAPNITPNVTPNLTPNFYATPPTPNYNVPPTPGAYTLQGQPLPGDNPYSPAAQTPLATPPSTPPPGSMILPNTQAGTQPMIPPAPTVLSNTYGGPLLPPQPQPTRTKLSPTIMALIAVVVLLLIVSSGLLYYNGVYVPNQIHLQATGTAQAHAASTAHADATSRAIAFATSNAEDGATATANAQAQATQTAYQTLYTTITSGTPTINDPLSASDNYGWSDFTTASGGCQFTGGSYRSSAAKTFYTPCYATATNFANLALQVDITILNGHSGGLLFRTNGNGSGYMFRISTDGTYILNKFTSNGDGTSSFKTLTSGQSNALTQGNNQKNTIAIIAQGSTIYMYINQQYTDMVNDTTYTSGEVGVYTDSDTSGVEASFQNLEVWKI
jgi:serine/threonine protein kinase